VINQKTFNNYFGIILTLFWYHTFYSAWEFINRIS